MPIFVGRQPRHGTRLFALQMTGPAFECCPVGKSVGDFDSGIDTSDLTDNFVYLLKESAFLTTFEVLVNETVKSVECDNPAPPATLALGILFRLPGATDFSIAFSGGIVAGCRYPPLTVPPFEHVDQLPAGTEVIVACGVFVGDDAVRCLEVSVNFGPIPVLANAGMGDMRLN